MAPRETSIVANESQKKPPAGMCLFLCPKGKFSYIRHGKRPSYGPQPEKEGSKDVGTVVKKKLQYTGSKKCAGGPQQTQKMKLQKING